MPPGTHTTLTFDSGGDTCAAWLTRPAGAGPHPAVVLVHGFGANHTMSLEQYEQHFCQAGIATLACDYRGLGASGGYPRQRLSLRRHRQDVAAAFEFLTGLPDIDAGRVGLWGTSLGAMHALKVAAARPDVAAVVVQCPIVDGPAVARQLGLGAVLRLTAPIVDDVGRRLLGRTPHYVPIVGPPGAPAAVTAPGALEGWNSTVSPGGSFDNRVGASDIAEIALTSATRTASRITAPALICVSDRETLMDPRRAADIARRAPRGEARHYDADHFDVYHPPLLAQLLADQTDFLRKHLNVGPA
ncbi:alpha/beta hydrolase [Mycolicibacterium vinylchloridicum]|uniref:alpha/beta hydrolase n=1 Tax=Mycolicibacterium vinylchloridicum TaxID=2736928 RepID=UPI0015CAD82F|nr:alpha/beta hydrolase [Mycolicibacterium vinylchloridicum]